MYFKKSFFMKKLLQLSLLFVLLFATSFTTKAATYTYNPTLLTFSIELQANENLLITQSGINNVFTINTGTFTTGGTTAVGNNTTSITVPIVDLTTSVTITKVANSGAITFSGTGALTSTTVSIASTGSITSAATFNVNATNLSINSASSIGSTTNPIKGSIFNVGGTASAGDFCIENTGTNNLNTNSNTFSNTSGSIFLKSVGSLNILHQLQAVNNITLQTSGSTADIIITHGSIAGVLANNGIIKATSSRDLYFGISGLYGDSLGKGIDISAVRDINIQDYSYVQSNGSSGLKAIAGRDMRILDNSIFNGNTPTLTHIINAESLFIDNASTAANDSFIQINANNISLTNSGSINTTNVVALKPLTIGRTIDLGTATSTSLSLTNAQLKQIIASKLIIGDSNSGNVLISDVIDRNAITNIKVISGSNINFNPGTISSNGGTLELNALNIKPIVNATDAIASSTIITGGASFDINGTTIGTGASATYTQLKLVGSINITNATLAVSGTHTPVVGQSFTVIDNDGADAIVGTFIGLTEGAAIYNFLGSVFTATISYTGGSGNDVVLTIVCPTITAGTTTNPTTCGGVNGSIAFASTNVPNGSYTINYTKNTISANATVTVASNAFSLTGLGAGVYTNFEIVFSCATVNVASITLSDPVAPTAPTATPQTFCGNGTVADLTTTSGTNIKWYAASTGGTALASTTALVNNTTYYASQSAAGGCESARTAVLVTITGTFIVTNLNDTGAGSFRQALEDANASSCLDPIVDATGVTGKVSLLTILPDISNNMTINGPLTGDLNISRSTIFGTPNFRIFTNTATTTINRLTISNGNDPSQAGGVNNGGNLTMNNCIVTGNTSGQGAGIQNDGIISLTNCVVADNIGGSFISYGTTNTFINCTFKDAINIASGSVTILNTIVSNFSASNVLAGSNNNLVYGTNSSSLTNGVNGNIIGGTPNFLNAADLNGTDNVFRTADDGLTLTCGSQALNTGTIVGGPALDIIGNIIFETVKDIGAYENQNSTSKPTLTLGAGATICAGATSFTISYTNTTGSPLTYSISGPGMNAVVNATLPPSPITINLTGPSSVGNYTYAMTVKNATGCESLNIAPTLAVNPYITAVSFSPSPSIATGATSFSIPFTTTGGGTINYSISGPNIVTVTNAVLPASPLIVNLINPALATDNLFYYNILITSTIGACSNYNYAGVVVVNNVIPVASPTNQTVCSGTPITDIVMTPITTTSPLSLNTRNTALNRVGFIGSNKESGTYFNLKNNSLTAPLIINSFDLSVYSFVNEPATNLEFEVYITSTANSGVGLTNNSNVWTKIKDLSIAQPALNTNIRFTNLNLNLGSSSIVLAPNASIGVYIVFKTAPHSYSLFYRYETVFAPTTANADLTLTYVATGIPKFIAYTSHFPFSGVVNYQKSAYSSWVRDNTTNITGLTVPSTPAFPISGNLVNTTTTLQTTNFLITNYALDGTTTSQNVVVNVTPNLYLVTNLNDSGTGSFRQAIINANANLCSNAIIDATAITGKISLLTQLPALTKNMVINGSLTGDLNISRDALATNFRIITNDANTTINRLTITNGNDVQGGGIQNNLSRSLTLNSCIISNNTAAQGAGIQNDGIISLSNCVVANNTGGSFISYGTANTFINCTVKDGINIASGSLSILNSIISNLTASNVLAGSSNNVIYNSNASSLVNGTNGNIIGTFNPIFTNDVDSDGTDNIFRTADDGLSLSCLSPCFNAGTNTGAPLTDIMGSTRPAFTTADIGAYESQIDLNPAVPTVTTPQTFCGSYTVTNLVATGTNIKWYDAQTGGNLLAPATTLTNGTTYYASQTTGTCESARTAVAVTINALPTITLGAGASICAGATSFTILYTAATGSPTTYSISGPGMTAVVNATLPPSPITINLTGPSSVGNYSYTMTVKNAAGCQSVVVSPTLAVVARPAAPTAADQAFCIANNPTVANLVPAISATKIWYNTATGGTALVGTTALTTGDYYVANLSGNCESNRTKATATVTPVLVPTVATYSICQNAVVPVGEGLVANNQPSVYTNTINDNIVVGPTYVRGYGNNTTTYNTSRPVFYKAYTFISPISGAVTFQTTFANFIPFDGADTYLTLYQTSFNPATPATNFLRGDDDSGSFLLSSLTETLVAGQTYVIVVSPFDSGDTGPFTLQASQNVFSNTPTFNWYTSATGGSSIFTGNVFNPVGVAGSGIADTATPATTTFYVASADNVDCRTAVTFTVNPAPAAGIAVGTQTACANSQLSSMIITGFTGTITKWQKSNSPSFSSPIDISGSNSSILSGPTLGTVLATTYFRAVISNGTCTTFSNVVVVSVISTTYDNSGTWTNGIPNGNMAIVFDKDFNISSDLSACACQVNTGVNVTVSNAATLSLVNNLDVQGSATMTFDNNTSLLQTNNYIANTGNILYNRTTTPYERYDYEYWSTPVSNPAMTLPVLNVPFANWRLTSAYKYAPENYNDDLLNDGYDDTGDDWSAIAPTTVLQPAKGYAIMAPTDSVVFAPSAIANVTFEGIPNNGIILIPMVLSPIPASTIPYPQANYNLIGNPYPSALDADNLINTNLANISGSLYFWTHVGDLSLANPGIFPSNYNASDYALYNLSGGTAATSIGALAVPTGKIASGQGFFVKADTANPVLFTNDMRIANNNNQFFRSSNPFVTNTTTETIKDRLWLNLSNNSGMFSQQLVAYLPNSSLDFDKGYDGLYSKTSNYINFYSHLNNQDSDIYKIQSRGSFQDNDVVKLGYFSSVAGDFKISIDQVEGVLNAESTNIYLQDNLTNTIHNLKTSDYNFTTAIGDFKDRFVLRYTNQLLTNSEFEVYKNDIIVYKNNQTINIVSTNTDLKEVQIYDIRGRLIAENKIPLAAKEGTRKVSFDNLNIAQQILIVKTKTIDNKIITKKIVF